MSTTAANNDFPDLRRTLTDILEDELYHMPATNASEPKSWNSRSLEDLLLLPDQSMALPQSPLRQYTTSEVQQQDAVAGLQQEQDSKSIFNKYADPTLTTTSCRSTPAATTVANTGFVATPVMNTVSLSKISAVNPFLTRLPKEQRIRITNNAMYNDEEGMMTMGDDEYVDYCDDGKMMFWPLQDNNMSTTREAMSIFDQEYEEEDDYSDDDDGAEYDGCGVHGHGHGHGQLHGHHCDDAMEDDNEDGGDNDGDYGDDDDDDEDDDDDDENDEAHIFDRMGRNSRSSRLNNESFVDGDKNHELAIDDDDDDDDDDEDDETSSVFEDDMLFESAAKAARKPSVVCSGERFKALSSTAEDMTTISSPEEYTREVSAPVAKPIVSTPPAASSRNKKKYTSRRKSSSALLTPTLRKKLSPSPTHSGSATPLAAANAEAIGTVNSATLAAAATATATATAANSDSNSSISASASGTCTEVHTCHLINPVTGEPCLKKFSRPYDLIRHQKTIHAAKKKIFRCLVCIQQQGTEGYQKTFSRGDALSRHVKVKHDLSGAEAQKAIQFAKDNVEYVSA